MTIKDLAKIAPGEDVRANITGVNAVFYTWNAQKGIHEPMTIAAAAEILGSAFNVVSYFKTLREIA
jgi:hypothetical protein